MISGIGSTSGYSSPDAAALAWRAAAARPGLTSDSLQPVEPIGSEASRARSAESVRNIGRFVLDREQSGRPGTQPEAATLARTPADEATGALQAQLLTAPPVRSARPAPSAVAAVYGAARMAYAG